MDKNKYYRNFYQYPAYHRKIHPELFDIGDVQDGQPGLQQCLHNQFGTLDLKRNAILGTISDSFDILSITGGGPYTVNIKKGYAYCNGNFTEVAAAGLSMNVGEYAFINSSGSFEANTSMNSIDGALIGKLTSSSVFTDMRNQRVLDTGVYYQYNAEHNVFRNKVDIKDDLKIYDVIICDSSTPDIGETGTRFGKAWLTDLEVTNAPKIGSGTDGQWLQIDASGIAQWISIHDSPVNGATVIPISSNWAYDHNATTAVGIHGSTNLNTASRLVHRDASGNFSAGGITATDYTVSSQTRYYSISPHQFVSANPDTDDVTNVYTGYIEVESGNPNFYIPVHLPHGATLVSMKLYGSNSAIQCTLERIDRAGGGPDTVIASTINTEGTNVLGGNINNSSYSYRFFLTDTYTGNKHYGGYIKYTITKPYP